MQHAKEMAEILTVEDCRRNSCGIMYVWHYVRLIEGLGKEHLNHY
jgi:hypothetical protein